MAEFTEQSQSPMRELLVVAVPTVATMTSYTVMTFVDGWIVSRLGTNVLGAQGIGGISAWVPQSLVYGLVQVVNTYVSQNLGAGRPRSAPAYAWNGLWIVLVWWTLILLPFATLLPALLRQTQIDPWQAQHGAAYAQILLVGGLINLSTRALSNFFFGLHKAGVVMIAGIVANILNLFFNTILVFGNGPTPQGLGWLGDVCHAIATTLSIPAQGIEGSAYGTVLATAIELLIPLAVFLGPSFHDAYGTRHAWRPSLTRAREIVRLGWPGAIMMGNEMVCWWFFMVYLVGHFGPLHASAGRVAQQYMSLSFMPTVGISVACTAVVGKCMGMRRPDLALQRARLAVMLAVVYMGVCGLVFVTFREHLVRLFVTPETPEADASELIRLGSLMLIATACFQLFDAVGMVLSGALRGAGDTVWPGLATIASSWVLIVGGGLLLVHVFPQLSSLGPWIASACYIVVLCFLLLFRFLQGHWKTIELVHPVSGGH